MTTKESEHSIEYQYKCPKCGKNICVEVPKSRTDIVVDDQTVCMQCLEPELYELIVK